MLLSEIMLPEFDREMARTRKLLESIPKESMDWKPKDDMHTIGWNANHLVEIVGWTPMILAQEEFDMAPVDGPPYETPSIDDPKALLADFDRNVASARDALRGTTDAKMGEDWSLKQAGQTLFTISKGECLRTWVLNHTVHHRAILSLLLRLDGVEITPVYDE